MDIGRHSAFGQYHRHLHWLTLALLLMAGTAQAQDVGFFRGDSFIKINRGSKIVLMLDTAALRRLGAIDPEIDSAIKVIIGIINDSLETIPRTQGGSSGRTYVTDARNLVRPVGTIDSSTAGLYVLDYGFGTLNHQGYTNFNNNGAGGADSTSFQLNGLALNGFILPIESAYPIMFERFALKTAYTAGNAVTRHVWPSHLTANSDSAIFSLHLKTEFVGGTRRYYVRVYKLHSASLNGLTVPVNAGVLVCSQEIPADRFPPYGTSVQVRIEIWIRRL